MNSLRHLDDQILTALNDFARHTGWLHGVVLGYATYGLVLFAALLLAGLWLRRTGSNRALAAAGWVCLAPLMAVGLNQPWSPLSPRPGRTQPTRTCWCLPHAAATSPSPPTTR